MINNEHLLITIGVDPGEDRDKPAKKYGAWGTDVDVFQSVCLLCAFFHMVHPTLPSLTILFKVSDVLNEVGLLLAHRSSFGWMPFLQ